jgi:serine protease Do
VSSWLATLLALGLLFAGCRRFRTGSEAEHTLPAPSAALPAPLVTAAASRCSHPSFADLAARVDPAVVYVRTLQRGRSGSRRVSQGVGSAFVYDPGGFILTNHHLIENATAISVTFKGQREMEAEVVGADRKTDLAVLRVDARGLDYLPLGDSDTTRVGDWVVAIGNPFGLSHTVSAGIVSAKGRTGEDLKGLGDPAGYYNFLQTDASINPGNSGGPLLDLGGRVVGINTAIRAGANSIGFAIPINMVKELLPRLIKDGKVRRSAIGIHAAGVAQQDAERLGLKGTQGALVRRVASGGPADQAGLKVDDVIIGFQGQNIPGPERLRWAASLAGVGSTVALRVVRGPRAFDLRVKLGELLDDSEEPDPLGSRDETEEEEEER